MIHLVRGLGADVSETELVGHGPLAREPITLQNLMSDTWPIGIEPLLTMGIFPTHEKPPNR